jgi:hypothetical protein
MNLSPSAGTTLRVGHLAPSCFRSELPEAHPFLTESVLRDKSVPPLKLDAPRLRRLGGEFQILKFLKSPTTGWLPYKAN